MHLGLFERRSRERFERDVLQHVAPAYNFARWLVGDAHDAEDAVQDAVLRALKSFDSYRGGEMKSWFLAIVRNSCLNILRAKNRRADFESDEPDRVESVATAAHGPHDVLEKELDEERLRVAIEALPPVWREVLILREFEQMSYSELATVTGVPIGTVMSRISRARQRLRVALAEELL